MNDAIDKNPTASIKVDLMEFCRAPLVEEFLLRRNAILER